MLSPYRVLDLTDEKGLMCGKIMGDLGADVIKIERPGGDPSRNIGPFWQDEPDPEKSLFWFALNVNKRGITLDLNATTGRGIFKSWSPLPTLSLSPLSRGISEDLSWATGSWRSSTRALFLYPSPPSGKPVPTRTSKVGILLPGLPVLDPICEPLVTLIAHLSGLATMLKLIIMPALRLSWERWLLSIIARRPVWGSMWMFQSRSAWLLIPVGNGI